MLDLTVFEAAQRLRSLPRWKGSMHVMVDLPPSQSNHVLDPMWQDFSLILDALLGDGRCAVEMHRTSPEIKGRGVVSEFLGKPL